MSPLLFPVGLFLGPFVAGTAAAVLSARREKRSVAGLLFHSITATPKLNLSSFSTSRFERLLRLLESNGVKTPTVSQQLVHPPSSPAAAITFDDGLLDFYSNAFPLLEERNMKSTVYMVAGHVGGRSTWDVMSSSEHLTAPMIREIAYRGHEIGSHSLTHPNLLWLDDVHLAEELKVSKAILEDITGAAVKSISFPFGSWNQRIWDAAREAGYQSGTAYRNHNQAPGELLPVFGVYRFDKAEDILSRAFPKSHISASRTLARIMSHFSKGSSICKFRKEYRRFPFA